MNNKCLFCYRFPSFIVTFNNTKKWIIKQTKFLHLVFNFSKQFLLKLLMENICLFSYFSHLNVLWEAFIEISFTMCQMATTLNTNKIIFDGTITAKLSFIWWKWLFLVLFYKKTHPQFCNKNASLQKQSYQFNWNQS